MNTTEQPEPLPSTTNKWAVAAVGGIVLCIALGAALFSQQGKNQELQEQLNRAAERLDRHGAIELTDSRRLHLRWLPTSRRQEELACRIHVPANQAYRLNLHAGQIPPHGFPAEDSEFFGFPVEIPTHDVDREITVIGGLTFNRKQETWEIFCRVSDVSGIEYPLNGATLFLPPASQRFFYLDDGVRTFEPGVDRTKTCVFDEDKDHLLLAVARAYEPPLDADGNVDYGGMSPFEWIETQKDKPTTGFMYWLERPQSE